MTPNEFWDFVENDEWGDCKGHAWREGYRPVNPSFLDELVLSDSFRNGNTRMMQAQARWAEEQKEWNASHAEKSTC